MWLSKYGLAPYFHDDLLKKMGDNIYVLSFDEALNRKVKQAQMDLLVRFWDEKLMKLSPIISNLSFLVNVGQKIYWRNSNLE